MSGLDAHIRQFWPTPVGFVRARTARPSFARTSGVYMMVTEVVGAAALTSRQIAKQIFTIAFPASAPAFRSYIDGTKSLKS